MSDRSFGDRWIAFEPWYFLGITAFAIFFQVWWMAILNGICAVLCFREKYHEPKKRSLSNSDIHKRLDKLEPGSKEFYELLLQLEESGDLITPEPRPKPNPRPVMGRASMPISISVPPTPVFTGKSISVDGINITHANHDGTRVGQFSGMGGKVRGVYDRLEVRGMGHDLNCVVMKSIKVSGLGNDGTVYLIKESPARINVSGSSNINYVYISMDELPKTLSRILR